MSRWVYTSPSASKVRVTLGLYIPLHLKSPGHAGSIHRPLPPKQVALGLYIALCPKSPGHAGSIHCSLPQKCGSRWVHTPPPPQKSGSRWVYTSPQKSGSRWVYTPPSAPTVRVTLGLRITLRPKSPGRAESLHRPPPPKVWVVFCLLFILCVFDVLFFVVFWGGIEPSVPMRRWGFSKFLFFFGGGDREPPLNKTPQIQGP